MPFYLVNHTSLVEAGDENAAARMVQAKIRDDDVLFTVKYDEHKITQVRLQAPPAAENVSGSSDDLLGHSLNEGVEGQLEVVAMPEAGEKADGGIANFCWVRTQAPGAIAILTLGILIGLAIGIAF